MTKAEKKKLKDEIEIKIKTYLDFLNRDDYPSKPCVCRSVFTLQNTIFNIAEVMWHCGIITWEECCEYWSRAGFVDEDEKCSYLECGANENGVCQYVIEKRGGRQ